MNIIRLFNLAVCRSHEDYWDSSKLLCEAIDGYCIATHLLSLIYVTHSPLATCFEETKLTIVGVFMSASSSSSSWYCVCMFAINVIKCDKCVGVRTHIATHEHKQTVGILWTLWSVLVSLCVVSIGLSFTLTSCLFNLLVSKRLANIYIAYE